MGGGEGPGGQDPHFRGTPKLHEEGNNIVCVNTNGWSHL